MIHLRRQSQQASSSFKLSLPLPLSILPHRSFFLGGWPLLHHRQCNCYSPWTPIFSAVTPTNTIFFCLINFLYQNKDKMRIKTQETTERSWRERERESWRQRGVGDEVDTGDEWDHRYAPLLTTTSTTAFGLLLLRLRARERERWRRRQGGDG